MHSTASVDVREKVDYYKHHLSLPSTVHDYQFLDFTFNPSLFSFDSQFIVFFRKHNFYGSLIIFNELELFPFITFTDEWMNEWMEWGLINFIFLFFYSSFTWSVALDPFDVEYKLHEKNLWMRFCWCYNCVRHESQTNWIVKFWNIFGNKIFLYCCCGQQYFCVIYCHAR